MTTTAPKIRKGQRMKDRVLDELVTVESTMADGDDKSCLVFGLTSGRKRLVAAANLAVVPTDRDVKRRGDSILAAARSYHDDGLGPFVEPKIKTSHALYNSWTSDVRRWAESWQYLLTSRPLGRRIVVHVWEATREATLKLVEGDGRTDDFRTFASVTIANAHDDEIAAAVALLASIDR